MVPEGGLMGTEGGLTVIEGKPNGDRGEAQRRHMEVKGRPHGARGARRQKEASQRQREA
jgi:hypothetical protein